MGSTPSHEDDDPSESGVHANVTIDVFLVGKLRTDMSSFSDAG